MPSPSVLSFRFKLTWKFLARKIIIVTISPSLSDEICFCMVSFRGFSLLSCCQLFWYSLPYLCLICRIVVVAGLFSVKELTLELVGGRSRCLFSTERLCVCVLGGGVQCLFDQSCSSCYDELAVRLAMTSLCISSWNECQRWVTANAEVKVASLAPGENQTIASHVPGNSTFPLLACLFLPSVS